MRRINYVRLYALYLFGLMAGGCLALTLLTPQWYGLGRPWVLLAVGAGLMGVAIPFHISAGSGKLRLGAWKRLLYLPALILNLIGTSFCEAAYYTHIRVRPPETELIAGAVIPVGLCLACLLIAVLLPRKMTVVPLICGFATVGMIIFCIVMWVRAGLTAQSVPWSFAMFNLIGVLLAIIAHVYTCAELPDDEPEAVAADAEAQEDIAQPVDPAWSWLRYLSFASFGLLMIAGVVVAVILICASGDCDCDCGDCCDCSGGGDGTGAHKKRRRR